MVEKGSNEIDRSKLLNAMTDVFGEGDLRTLCFELDLDYDDLPPGGRGDKARELIIYCQHTGRLDDLLALCHQKRPHVDWDAVSQSSPLIEDPQAVIHEGSSDIFLSYSRKDSQMKERLLQDLRQAGLTVWTDDGLVPGTPSWHQTIESQIESAGCLVVLLSPDAKNSVWVRRELDYGAAQGKRIFPAMISGTPNNAVPITIIDAQFVDLRREYAKNIIKLRDALAGHLGQVLAPPEPATIPPEGIAIPHIVTGAPPLHIEWCWVPPGPFIMGSDERNDEKPVHTLKLPGFWLARYPLTNAHYRLFVEAGGYEESRWWTEAGWQWRKEEDIKQPQFWTDGKWNGDDQPVVGASWYEALAFAHWAAETTGEPTRLPTEAEWEKAARGTDGRAYPWGDQEPTAERCNFGKNVGRTTPVGQYSPAGDGPYGNADLIGNVWEWTSSLYNSYPYDAQDGWEDLAAEGRRVVRGVSWYRGLDFARVAYRNSAHPNNCDISVGFRLVRRSPSS